MKFWPWKMRRRRESDLNDEIESHLRMAAEERSRTGETAEQGEAGETGETGEQARLRAQREFGNVTLIKEVTREMWGLRWLETSMQDVRYGLRQLRRSPGFTIVAVLTLALGIGANSLIFSIVNAAILHPLPFRDSDKLVTVWATSPTIGFSGPGSLTDSSFEEWRKENRVFSDVAAFRAQASNLTEPGDPLRLTGASVTPSLFSTLEVSPELGRGFAPEEANAGSSRVALLGDQLWRSRFGGDANALGRSIILDGELYTVIGVMPAGFGFPNEADIWTPLVLKSDEHNATLQIVARLKPGVSMERARGDVAMLESRHPAPPDGWEWHTTLVPLTSVVTSDVRTPLLVLFAAAGLVLLIACANVANLFLARAATRQREIGIRKALGAGRSRLIRQMLTESAVMALAGGCAGLLLAALGQRFVAEAASLLPGSMGSISATARIASAGIDAWVLGFTLALSLLTVVIFGVIPAFRVSRADVSSGIKESSPRISSRGGILRDGIVVAEVALTMMLLIGAGLLTRGFLNLMKVKPGFDSQNALTLNISLPDSRYHDPVVMIGFEQQALERLSALPGVKNAGGVYGLPLGEMGVAGDFTVEGQAPPPPGGHPFIAAKKVIGGDYFRAIGIPLVEGRAFDDHDSREAPRVVIVSRKLAQHFWPSGSAIGRHLKPGFGKEDWSTVVGVVGDVKDHNLEEGTSPSIYIPYSQAPMAFLMQDMAFVVRTESSPISLATSARLAVQRVDPELPVFNVSTMVQRVDRSNSAPRFNTALLSIFAALALALSTVGVYGVMSYTVTQRTHEIGIRMALGAATGDIVRQVALRGLTLAAGGISIGLAGAWAVSGFLSGLLFGVQPTDPETFFVVALLMIAVGFAACILPARRATKVDPMEALRYE